MKNQKPKIRKYNKKLKKIEDEEKFYELEEELLLKHNERTSKW